MSCYVIESDKLFLRCKDIQVIEVYEIDSLYIAPVLQKHWSLIATVHLGDGQKFEALQIGDRDIISACDLGRLMQDLMSLGMMVNREGLCFLKTPESNVLDQCQVEYYRMFDLFDWSKYYVKSRLNTRWVRNDIVTGRPIFVTSSEKDAELIEIKRLHSGAIMELKRKHEEVVKAYQEGLESSKREIEKWKLNAKICQTISKETRLCDSLVQKTLTATVKNDIWLRLYNRSKSGGSLRSSTYGYGREP